MHALTPASPIAIRSYSSTTIWKLASTAFWPPARRRWLWTIDSPKHMLPEGSRSHSGNDMRKQSRNSKRQSRLIPIHSRLITSMPVPASRRGKLERAATLFERAAENKPDDYQALCLLIQVYRSLGRPRESESAARRGIERAKNELMVHPENARPAYLGAAALATLGEKEQAREWASRALSIDPDDVLTQYNIAC